MKSTPTNNDPENAEISASKPEDSLEWDLAPENPLNWASWKKIVLMAAMSASAISVSISTSIITPARDEIMEEFGVSSTVAILSVSLYVLALGFGPVVGGPLSETIGRYPVYLGSIIVGAAFTIGAGFTHNFGALLFCRFMAGFVWAPVLAVAPGSLSETFLPKARGPASAIFILMPFLGPGLGPVIGSFVVTRKDWRWTQWTVLFFAAFSLLLTLAASETFHPILKRRLARKRGQEFTQQPPLATRLRHFAVVALVRPIQMLLLEPIVSLLCLYVACEFGTLFSFFAAVPYTFGVVYGFSLDDSGLIFLSIIIGCVLGFLTVVLCDIFFYRKQIPRYPPHRVPPEYRLFPAMIGSIGLPIGLFWFGWSAREGISWVAPAAAIIPFAWGNLCVFVSSMQYITDTYHGSVVASAASANSLARYGFAGIFPLFTIQMYEKLGIGWASSLLGFIALALLPIPWVFFKYGPDIRARSRFEMTL
ncbi:major facilitator superfamily domain-containing protein [Talaromyces proteolyticus]|uniref:Major facilitator superfamily domain-containing protein n=1 Tax=Talaromyces proteolyticus TaxID=1131652 RepID=A0AAD4PVK7_9EURO|nr:major facilitator superfamily domain-containing protein [Talaromyces proteolyticus]KAH8691448.1 major facilitator superfamily domain-containing protein [Talaromyces proteolyticus]